MRFSDDRWTFSPTTFFPLGMSLLLSVVVAYYVNTYRNSSFVDAKYFLLLIIIGHAPLLIKIFFNLYHKTYRRFDLFDPHVIFPLAITWIYGLGSLQLVDYERKIRVSQYTILYWGFLGLFLGFLIARLFFKKIPIFSEQDAINTWNTNRILWISLFLFTLSSLAFVYAFWQSPIPIFHGDVEVIRTEVVKRVGGWVVYLIRTMLVPVTLVIALLITGREGKKQNVFLWSPLILWGLFVVASLGYRGRVLHIILASVIVYHYAVKRIRPLQLIVVGSFFVALLVLTGLLRKTGGSGIEAGDFIDRAFKEIQIPSSSLQVIAENVPSPLPHLRGLVIILPFLALLPGEQPALGLLIKDALHMDFAGGGFVPSLMGGFYLDFGLPAVFLGMVFYGVALGWIYQNMVRKKSLFWILIYANILVYALNSIRGMFMQDLFFVWFLVVLTGIHFFTRKKALGGSRSPSKAGPKGSYYDTIPTTGG